MLFVQCSVIGILIVYMLNHCTLTFTHAMLLLHVHMVRADNLLNKLSTANFNINNYSSTSSSNSSA
jgi:hypothetical protein